MQHKTRATRKQKTREALIEAAARLFRRDGFDRTTVDQIAAEGGVSRRTFFRYFPTKEAVVFPNTEERLQHFREQLAQRTPGENNFEGLRRVCMGLARDFFIHRDELVLQHRLVQSSPTLMAYDRDTDRRWEAALAEALGQGSTTLEGQRRARILAGCAMGAIRAALNEWFATGGRADLVRLGEEAMELLERGFHQSPAVDRPAALPAVQEETL